MRWFHPEETELIQKQKDKKKGRRKVEDCFHCCICANFPFSFWLSINTRWREGKRAPQARIFSVFHKGTQMKLQMWLNYEWKLIVNFVWRRRCTGRKVIMLQTSDPDEAKKWSRKGQLNAQNGPYQIRQSSHLQAFSSSFEKRTVQ